jgi:hypothetical protein
MLRRTDGWPHTSRQEHQPNRQVHHF